MAHILVLNLPHINFHIFFAFIFIVWLCVLRATYIRGLLRRWYTRIDIHCTSPYGHTHYTNSILLCSKSIYLMASTRGNMEPKHKHIHRSRAYTHQAHIILFYGCVLLIDCVSRCDSIVYFYLFFFSSHVRHGEATIYINDREKERKCGSGGRNRFNFI